MSSADPDVARLIRTLVRNLRDAANTTLTDDAGVAEGAGLSGATLSRILSGASLPSVPSLVALARWAGYDVALAPRERGGGA